MDYCNFNQVVTLIVAVISLLEQSNTSPGTWHAAVDLANGFFSITMHEPTKNILHSAGQQYAFNVILQESINFPGQCHNLVHRYLDLLSLSQSADPFHSPLH